MSFDPSLTNLIPPCHVVDVWTPTLSEEEGSSG
jgi:hypothetical protein